MKLKTTLIIMALSTMAASATTREAWSGRLQQKSLDQHKRMVKRMVTINGGLLSSTDRFSQSSFYPPDPIGMDPLPTDTYAEGLVIMWDRARERVRGFRWKTTFAGEQTIERMPASIDMEPIGVSHFSGLMVTEEGRNKTIGGFAFEVKNLGPDCVTATITADWDANEMQMAHRTTHGGDVPPLATKVYAIVPERDEWAVASGVNAEVE